MTTEPNPPGPMKTTIPEGIAAALERTYRRHEDALLDVTHPYSTEVQDLMRYARLYCRHQGKILRTSHEHVNGLTRIAFRMDDKRPYARKPAPRT